MKNTRTDRFIVCALAAFIRADNGPMLIEDAVRNLINAVRAKTDEVVTGFSCESGYGESFNARVRDEMLNG